MSSQHTLFFVFVVSSQNLMLGTIGDKATKRPKIEHLHISESAAIGSIEFADNSYSDDQSSDIDSAENLSQRSTQPDLEMKNHNDLSIPHTQLHNAYRNIARPANYLDTTQPRADASARLHHQEYLDAQVWLSHLNIFQATHFLLQGSISWTDTIHGTFEIPALCVAIMNTPQFQVEVVNRRRVDLVMELHMFPHSGKREMGQQLRHLYPRSLKVHSQRSVHI
jgi:hypothetical protein